MTLEKAIEFGKIFLKSIENEKGSATYEFVEMAVKMMEQEQKTGHWILADEQNKEDVDNDNYRFICSECQCSDIHAKGTKVPYCWKCGSKMESEGK